MGVKVHLIFNSGSRAVLGPRIFYDLVSRYEDHYRAGYLDIPFSKLKLPESGWRKKAVALFRIMSRKIGSSAGVLKELKVHNVKSDPSYRNAKDWVDSHTTRPRTPPRVRNHD